MERKIEDVDGSPGDEEEGANQDQHHVCSLLPCNFPCFADAGEVPVWVRGRDTQADSGIEDTDNDTGKDELDEDTDESVCEVAVVWAPVLESKLEQAQET